MQKFEFPQQFSTLGGGSNPKLKRNIIIAIVLAVLLLGGIFGFRMFMMMQMGGKGGGFGGDFPTAVSAFPPRAERADRTIRAVGTLTANQSITIAPEIAGRIKTIPGNEGQAVKAGDVLVELDSQISKADLEEAEANAILAQANYARAKSLASQKFGTERSKDEALAAVRQAIARHDLAKAKVEKMFLMAPFDGILGLRQRDAGAYVNPGEAILTLTSVDPVYVDFRVPELKSGGVKFGQKITIEVDALSGRMFEGIVTAIDPQLDTGGRSLGVRAKIANDKGELRPGLFARVNLSYAPPEDVLIVPERAIFLQGNDTFVYRAVDGKAILTKVELGERRVGEVEVVKGIALGDEIITDGQIKLRPDAKVMILNKPNLPPETKTESKAEPKTDAAPEAPKPEEKK
jgi:membrane fusion protein (multidrug efflux system)